MAILIDIQMDDWISEEQLRNTLQPLLPGVPIYCREPENHANEILMLAAARLRPGILQALPNLKVVQKLGAGVDSIVGDPDLTDSIRVCRLKPDIPAHEIAEYCLAYVLGEQRHHRIYAAQQSEEIWKPLAPIKTAETTVAVLGLGHIGSRVAHYFSMLGFRVVGWSRSRKQMENIECEAGDAALGSVLSAADYVVSILPSTPATRHLINQSTLSQMRSTAVLINVGRGDLVNTKDLLNALDAGVIRGAVLDVFEQEPLDQHHPFWQHSNVTMTPHVSGWHLDGGMEVVAQNYLAILSGEPLQHEVDVALGY